MRELTIAPGLVFRLAVEEDSTTPAHLIFRLGNGQWRPISRTKARLLAELLDQGAAEIDKSRGERGPTPADREANARAVFAGNLVGVPADLIRGRGESDDDQ